MNVSEWPNWESIVIRKPLLTLMLAMIAPGSVGRNAAQAEGLAGDATLSEEMLNTPGCMRSISPVLSKVQTFRQRRIASGAKAIFAAFALFAASTRSARAEDAGSSFLTQPSLTDTPDGPKEQLRSIGIMPDFWVTQFYQGQTEGDGSKTWRYGGKVDAFLRVDAEKLGLWPGFHVNAQYEHYFGQNINRTDFALIPVNTALAYVERDGYHSALSVSVTQDLGEYISLSAGKFNMMTLASKTPLIGGGGIDTFMNRAFALPSTGVAYTALRGGAGDRVVLSAPYLIGAIAAIKTEPVSFALMIADPRSAIDPRVIEHPFEKGLAVGGAATLKTEIAGLRGFHTVRAAYSNARGVDLDDIADLPRPSPLGGLAKTKKGFWFASYAIQQNFVQSEQNPELGWGLFTLATLSDGNPSPVRWSVLAGLGGNNLLVGRENDRWGAGFFHFGLTEPLLAGLAALDVNRRSEGGVEAFYNLAITPWLRLSADLQVIDPWNPSKSRATYAALRLQTKF
jgi:porin